MVTRSERALLSDGASVARVPGMTALQLLPRQFHHTVESIQAMHVQRWEAGVLPLRVRAEQEQMYPFALEACEVVLELEDGHCVPVSLRLVQPRLHGWRRYAVRFHVAKDMLRVRFPNAGAFGCTVEAIALRLPGEETFYRFHNGPNG